MDPPSYRNMMEGKDKEGHYGHRLRMVRHAQEYGDPSDGASLSLQPER
jgi:hypothetical protein